ncbi:EAL domain-containing protein [Rhizobium sp. S152]|uniref:bifunctional diguanylate cyclase/phosphodiesterase n=1 Tax=Rhizobium sp. S152 TaxID=3055038 RepID=UPI0025A9A2B6|nr:EAL domain-containing protein [Rhizobium sp. S152]MDM9626979.1 EAL domain-containing protein [Rhizobium sp. S152]
MFSVLACIRDNHDWRLIVAAVIVCLIGNLAAMLLLFRAGECDPGQQRSWMAASALACGVGIWATHFIAMLAYDGAFPISYGVGMTALSVVLSIGASWLAILVATEWESPYAFAGGGLIMAIGICSMHMTGMQAIEETVDIVYNPTSTMIALLIGMALASAAFFAFRELKGTRRVLVAAVIMVLAIAAIHFTSMSTIMLVPQPGRLVTATLLETKTLAGIVMAVSTALILAALSAVFLASHLTDLRGLANASMEGLLVLHEGRIMDANERFQEMSGWSLAELRGNLPSSVLALAESGGETRHQEASLTARDETEIPVDIMTRRMIYRGRNCQVLVVRDLTERKRAEEMIEHLAHHDVLTGLTNRSLYDTRLRHALQMAERKRSQIAIFCLDLDRFKAVNDIFGHAEGDRILCRVAAILKRVAGDGDTVARLGGDEFAIIQTGKPQPEAAQKLAGQILDGLAAEMDVARDPTAVGASLGIAVYPIDGRTAEELCDNADTALYRAKHAGRGKACFFDAEMDEAVRARRQIEAELRHAITRNQLYVNYQPILDSGSGAITGYEALIRWNRPGHGISEPEVFIAIAEESGAIVQLGEWVLRQACAEAALWPKPLTIAVNVSPVQFMLPNLCERITAILDETGLPPQRLELEVTEAAFMRDRNGVIATLMRLHKLGVRIVMDDFGTGFCSLSNLRALPFDKIKVDRSFTGVLEHDAAARSIVRAIIGLGHSLGIQVVTEGVETELQRQIVVEEGCGQMQGLLFGKPDIEPSVKLAARANFLSVHGGERGAAQVLAMKAPAK